MTMPYDQTVTCAACGFGYYLDTSRVCPKCGEWRVTGKQRLRAVEDTPDDKPADESTWTPVDLTAALAGEDLPKPSILRRVDGAHLVYDGRTHWFQGESESCKSWAALVAAAQVLQQGDAVLWIDFEDDDRGVVSRLKSLSVPNDTIRDLFTYIRPEEPLHDKQGRSTGGDVALGQVLEARSYKLAVIDGVTEAMVTEGLDLIDNADVAKWMRVLPKRLASKGAAVICIDHVTKDKETQGRFAIGGQHKLAGVTGATYKFDVLRPFSRPNGLDPTEGKITMSVAKDRPGHVRGLAVEGKVAVLELTGYPDGGVSAAFTVPGDEPAPDLGMCHRVLAYLADYDGSSMTAVEKGVEGKGEVIRSALRWMAADERAWVRVQASGRSHLHFLTDLGREQL